MSKSVIPDPVFAAINLHRQASDAWMAAAELVDKGAAKEKGRTVTPADVEANERAVRLEREAMAGLIQTMPTTMAGLQAALNYFVAWDGDQMCEDASAGLQALLRSPLFEASLQPNNDSDHAEAFRAMETPIFNIKHMSIIAETLYDDFQPDNNRQCSDYVRLTLTSDQFETMAFAIHELGNKARECFARYERSFNGGSDAKA